MSRKWYVSPVRVRPGYSIPGRFNGEFWEGPSTGHGEYKGDMGKVRGPFTSAKEAAEAARVWREDEGKHSDIYLCLVETDRGDEVTHCNKYDPKGHEPGKRVKVSEEEQRARATGTAAAQEVAQVASERWANMFKAFKGMMEGEDAPQYKIERRPYPPWSPYGSQMVEIPLSSIRGEGRMGLLDFVCAARQKNRSQEPVAYVVSDNPDDTVTIHTLTDHQHDFQHGGQCSGCKAMCPHPSFTEVAGHISPICTTCGCLKPIEGSPDFYEIGLGDVQPCRLRAYPEEE